MCSLAMQTTKINNWSINSTEEFVLQPLQLQTPHIEDDAALDRVIIKDPFDQGFK